MRRSNTPRSWAAASPAALLLAGCVVAAAGAGAGGGIYFTQRGSNQSFPRQSSARPPPRPRHLVSFKSAKRNRRSSRA